MWMGEYYLKMRATWYFFLDMMLMWVLYCRWSKEMPAGRPGTFFAGCQALGVALQQYKLKK